MRGGGGGGGAEIEEQGEQIGVGGVERLEIEIYDIENDGAGSRSALPSLVAVNLAMRADQT